MILIARTKRIKMGKWICLIALLAAVSIVAVPLHAADYVVEQKNKAFAIRGAKVSALKIKVGDTIAFKNLDPYFHNVFSLSDAKLFDLGSYPQGQARSVTFDKPGKVEVECAIHPQMKITVEVK
jgi:plastocyanin